MNEFIYIYIYTVLNNISATLTMIFFLAISIAGIIYMFSGMTTGTGRLFEKENERHLGIQNYYIKTIKNKIVISAIVALFTLSVFLPSVEDIKTIVAGGLVWKSGKAVPEIDGVEELPENLVNAMNEFLKGIEKNKGK